MNYTEYGAGNRVIIFLHGWRQSAHDWHKLARRFANRGYHCYALDLPGFGKTPLSRVYTLDDYADDVEEFIATHDLRHPTIVAHSFGGKIAVILGGRQIPSHIMLLSTNLQLAATQQHRYIRAGLQVGLNSVMRSTFEQTHVLFTSDQLRVITAPMIVIHGRFDPVVSVRQAYAIARQSKSIRLVVCYRALHRPHREHLSHVERELLALLAT